MADLYFPQNRVEPVNHVRSQIFDRGDVRSQKKKVKHNKNSGNSGPTPVARGGSGAKAPPLAAHPALTPYHRRACGCRAGVSAESSENSVRKVAPGGDFLGVWVFGCVL